MAVTFVLLAVMLGSGFARFLARAAVGKLDEQILLVVVMISTVENLVVLIPISALLAVMLALGRLYRDNEITVISACGEGLFRLYRPFLILAVFLAIFTGWLSLYMSPAASVNVERLRKEGRQAVELSAGSPGVFRSFAEGNAVFYVESLDADTGTLNDIFIWTKDEQGLNSVVTADRGIQKVDKQTGHRGMVLFNGRRYEGAPGAAEFRFVEFEEHGFRVETPPVRQSDDLDLIPTADLFGTDDPELQAELQRRFAAPIAVIILTLLAVPLAHTTPRQGRYGKLIFGVIAYLVYTNLLSMAQIWIADGKLDARLGLWWVHGGAFAIAMLLVLRREGRLRLPRKQVAAT